MKNNKTIAYMIVAMLLASGSTFIGTKALFKKELDLAHELQISTGNLDIGIVEGEDGKNAKWSIVRNNGEDGNESKGKNEGSNNEQSEKLNDLQVDNLKYGDKLTKKIKFKNNGTLRAKVKLSSLRKIVLPLGIEYTAKLSGDDIKNGVIDPNGEGTIELSLEVTGKGKYNTDNINSDSFQGKSIDLNDSYILEASQIFN